MLLLYRVEGLTVDGIWKTILICRPVYRKTETFKTERYGFFRRKRRVVTSCNIHNEDGAKALAWGEALEYFLRNRDRFKGLRIKATRSIDGVISTKVVKRGDHDQHYPPVRS